MTAQGTVLGGRYRLLDVLGDGGMARVYRAEDERLNRIVAIKILHQHYLGQPEFVRRFLQEAQLAAGLAHPNIVSIYDVDRDGDTYFFVMEYVEGGSLKRLISREAPLALDRVIAIMRQIALALDAAHAHGVIHRDVKPENILLTPSEQVKVGDFGIARALTSPGQTATGMVLGSVSYFSPEQAQGKPATAESDIYSSGVVLYEMLTGKLPFVADNPLATAMQHITQKPPPPHIHAPGLSPAVEEVVLKALNKNPATRYHSGAALVEALAAGALAPSGRAPRDRAPGGARSGPPVTPPPTLRTRRVAGPPPPRRPAPLLPLAIIVLLGGGAFYAATHPNQIGALFAGGVTATPTPTIAAPTATPTSVASPIVSATPRGGVIGAPTATPSSTTAGAPGATSTSTSTSTSISTSTSTSAPTSTPTSTIATATPRPSKTPTPRPTVTPAPTESAKGPVSADIVVAKGMQMTDGIPQPIGAGDTFGAHVAKVFAIVHVHHLPRGASEVVSWLFPNGLSPQPYQVGASYANFYVFTYPSGPGKYSVIVFVNGKRVGSRDFMVTKGQGGTPQPHSRTGSKGTQGRQGTPTLVLAAARSQAGPAHGHKIKQKNHGKHKGQD